jgi:prepilin-type N-terminal cleavage/methylation domain-containing protein
MRPSLRRGFTRRRGFTLVELLVVMAVIGVLTAISFPILSSVRRGQKAKATKVLIENLKLKIEEYAADFGDFPPSNPKLLGLPSNGTNDGIECLVRCLSTKRKKGPYYEAPEEQLKNTDSDKLVSGNPTDSYMTTRELFELVDAFGNPLVYTHNAEYDSAQRVQLGDENGAGDSVTVKCGKSAKTGQYHGLRSFQLRSLGANPRDDGADDDVTSWSSGE